MNSSVRFCDNCGATNRPDARFCYACGQPQINYASASSHTVTGLLTSMYQLKQRYIILSKLGQGGFGAIYKVEDTLFQHTVRAVKEMGMRGLNPTETQEAIEAFRNEATLLANLSHPNLPRIYDHFEEHGRWYLVMDYIAGKTLATRLEEAPNGSLPLKEVLEIGLQLCTVLGYLHDHQPPIIFRDLKPDNVMLTATGHLYLIDFGIARFFKPGQTKDTMSLGTPGYAAPEQYGKAQTTIRSDIYSLGATMYHMISGIYPGLTPFLFQPLKLDPQQPANLVLETLIMQMLELKEENRPANTEVIHQKLLDIQQQLLASSQKKYHYLPPPPLKQPDATQTIGRNPTTVFQARPSLIVAQQGGGDYTSLSEAIQQAQPDTFILLKEGHYQESIILDKPVEIIANGAKEQIILESHDTHCVVMQTSHATIRGLTIRCQAGPTNKTSSALRITQGKLLLEDCTISSNSSACITIQNPESYPTIRYCSIQDGATHGISMQNEARAVLEYSEIFNHQLNGLHITQGSNPTLRHCKVYACQRHGLVAADSAQGTLEDSMLYDNVLSGIMVSMQSNPLLLRCQVQHNQRYGIEVQQEGMGSYQDCEIAGNRAANIAISGAATPYFYLCKIHDSEHNGVIIHNRGKGTLEYCDIFANQQANIAIKTEGDPLLQRTTLRQSQQYGLEISENGHGTIERCNFKDNAAGAFTVTTDSHATFRQNVFE